MGELSQLVLEHISHIESFFDKYVDENANRLVLAVYSYVKSEWFLTFCKIATMFYCEITFKIKKLIGMDEFKDTEDEEN